MRARVSKWTTIARTRSRIHEEKFVTEVEHSSLMTGSPYMNKIYIYTHNCT